MVSRQSSEKVFYKNILIHMSKIILPLLILFILFRYKPLLLLIIFEIFDFTKLLVLRKRFTQFPLDLMFVFGITAAYYYGFLIAIVVFVLGIINRMQVSHIEGRHVTKCIRHFTLFFLTSLLNKYSFFNLAAFMQLLNYILKYSVLILSSDTGIFEKSIYHIFNFITSLILFYIIEIVFITFPGLI